MDRLNPALAPDPEAPLATGSGPLRQTALGVLAVMVVAGGWIRFNDRIASVMPALAAPSTVLTDRAAGDGDMIRGLVELGLLPSTATAAAVASMGLPPQEAAVLAAAVQRGRVRLARLPLFDAGPVDANALDAAGTRSVQVSAGGYTSLVRLTRQPVVVTLPIGPVGSVLFRTAGGGEVAIGALTLDGPVRFPTLQVGQQLDVGVIAQ